MTPCTLKIKSQGKDYPGALIRHIPSIWHNAPLTVELVLAADDDTESTIPTGNAYRISFYALDSSRNPTGSALITDTTALESGSAAKARGPHAIFELTANVMTNLSAAADYWMVIEASAGASAPVVRAAGYISVKASGITLSPDNPTAPGTIYLTTIDISTGGFGTDDDGKVSGFDSVGALTATILRLSSDDNGTQINFEPSSSGEADIAVRPIDGTMALTSDVRGTGWATGVYYNEGDVVSYANALFVAQAAHTSSALHTPGALGETYWTETALGTGGLSSLVVSIVDSTATATNTALHLAYNPTALSIPSTTTTGVYGSLRSMTPGTVKLTLPDDFEIVYDDLDALPSGTTARPVVAYRGGTINFVMLAPMRILISGDYVTTDQTWHPTDEGDNLLALWKAGPSLTNGGHAWHPCAEAVGVTFPSNITNRWEALFGSTKNARFIYDWAANTDGGGDQGDSPTTYAPILVTDSNFPNGYAYALREGSATSHVMRALKDENTNLVPTAPCRIYIAARQTATGASAGSFLRINSSNAYFVGTKSGLVWYAATWGYQFVHDNSAGSFGTKPVGTTLEEVTTPVLLTLVITAGGAGSVYVGTTLVSNPLSINTAATISFLQFYAAQNIRLGGVAVINGTSSDLPTEIAAMQALLIS